MNEPDTFTKEGYEYGRLWPDGTFNSFGDWYSDKSAQQKFNESAYELENVPESLRPVLGKQRIVTTVETYPAEPVQEVGK